MCYVKSSTKSSLNYTLRTSLCRFAANIQTAGGSRFNDDNAGSGFNDDNGGSRFNDDNDSRFNTFQEEPEKVFEEVDER